MKFFRRNFSACVAVRSVRRLPVFVVDYNLLKPAVFGGAVPVKYADTSVPNSNWQSLLFWSPAVAVAVFVLAQEARKTVAKIAVIKSESDFFM